jgi:amino acid adenylation domain-containing protein
MAQQNIEAIYPLTPVQEGILFHNLMEPDAGYYFNQYHCRLRGPLDPDSFIQAWQQIVERHAVLRSLFTWEKRKDPLQIVRKHVELPCEQLDWQAHSAEEQEQRLEAYLEADRQRGFELTQPPLTRIALIKLQPDWHSFVWSFHHILLDGWSMRLLLDEAFTIYASLAQGSPLTLPKPKPFRSYLGWLQSQDLDAAERFWRSNLAGFEAPTRLHTTPNTNNRSAGSRQLSIKIDPGTTQTITTLARENRLTQNTVLQGAWALLLSRYSQETEVVFGTTVSGRPVDLPGVEQMVGLFINTLPFRTNVPPEMPFVAWLQTLQRRQSALGEYEYSPLARVQSWSDVPPGQALFSSILVFENHPATFSPAEASQLKLEAPKYLERSNYPLALLVVPGESLELILIHDLAQCDHSTGERLLGHLQSILCSLAQQPDQLLADVPLLGDTERSQMIDAWNQVPGAGSYPGFVHHWIEAQARRYPERIAVRAPGGANPSQRTMTYAALDRRANQLAQLLTRRGVGPDTAVGIGLERTTDLLVAILAVLKAGGAYVPLDPAYPAERLELMLADAGIQSVISQPGVLPIAVGASDLILLDEVEPQLRDLPAVPPIVDLHPEHLVYIIYTSGSTGRPKGIAVSHANLAHSTGARLDYYPVPIEAFLLLSSFAFDSSMVGIFGTLCQGGTLVLSERRQEQDVSGLVALIETHKISHMLALPSLHRLILEFSAAPKLASLKHVIVAGEACPSDLPGRHYTALPETILYNEYGPSEAAVWCTVHPIPPPECDSEGNGSSVGGIIGRPIPGTQIYILDASGHPLPVGVPGELFVGGPGIARGYLNRPHLTAARFVPDPFNAERDQPAESGGRLYRTGDLARYLSDGRIEFIGRVDQQIKIRGYRVELEEIEAALIQLSGVRKAAVLPDEDPAQTNGRSRADGSVPGSLDTLIDQLLTLDAGARRELLTEIEQFDDNQIKDLLTEQPAE